MDDYCRIENLTFRYFKDSDRNVLENTSLSFAEGEVTVILGNSGCGKSTLAAVLCGLYPENAGHLESGRIVIGGRDMTGLPFDLRCAYTSAMFQNPDLQFCMRTLREEMLFCLENIRTPREQMGALVSETARRCGTELLLDRPFAVLSGGEKQRAALTCLLLLNPKIMVLDEPFANLDDDAAESYLKILREKVRKEQTTVIAIDHRPDKWMDLADRFLILGEKGQVIRERLTPEQLPQEEALFEEQGLYFPFRKPASAAQGAAEGSIASVTREAAEDSPASAAGEQVVAFRDASIYHKKGKEPVLSHVTLTAEKGEIIACAGPSGAGKTTLFHALLKQKKYTGSIMAAGEEVSRQKEKKLFRRIGIVFQNPANQFVTTQVQQEVEKSLRTRGNISDEACSAEAEALLEEYGLRHFRRFSPFMLSQGQQRRLGVLTMTSAGQTILLLDEPTYGQDGRTTKAIMEQLRNEAERGVTVIFSTHDLDLAREYADRFWIVENGSAYETGCLPERRPAENFAGAAGPAGAPDSPAGVGENPAGAAVTAEKPAGMSEAPAEQAAPRRGLRSVNPTVKCIAILIAAVLLAFSFSLKWNVIMAAFCFCLMLISGINFKRFFAVIIPVSVVAASLFFTMVLNGAASGTAVVENTRDFYSVALQGADISGALAVAFRIYAFAFMGLLFALTTPAVDFMYSLMQQARMKPRFAYSILAAFNLVPVILRELSSVRLAYRVRGIRAGLIRPAFSGLVNTIHWSENLAMAMQSKGFEDKAERTMYMKLAVHPKDILFGAVLVALAAMGLTGL